MALHSPNRRVAIRIAFAAASLAAVWLIAASSVQAAGYPEPTRDYNADVTMRLSDGEGREQYTSRGREYYSGGKRRREMSMMGRETIHISRPDKGVSWTLIPSAKTYLEHREDDAKGGRNDMPDPLAGAESVDMKKVGAETVNGVKADKYLVEMEDGKGTAWMTADNIPVRFEGKMEAEGQRMEIRMDYENIQVGKQKAELFELPSGYRGGPAFSMPAFPGGGAPGGGMPGQDGRAPTDAEIEAYQDQMKESMEELRKQMEQMRGNQPGGR